MDPPGTLKSSRKRISWKKTRNVLTSLNEHRSVNRGLIEFERVGMGVHKIQISNLFA